MSGFRRLSFWLAVIVAYWLCARWFLFWVFRVWVDGGGPSPSFYWGNHPPAPTLAEWETSIHAQILVLCPYWIAAATITFLGCGLTTWLVRAWKPGHSRLFLASSATTLALLLLVEAISDAGTALHIWRGPTMYSDIQMVLAFLKVFVPMSLLAGVLALVRSLEA